MKDQKDTDKSIEGLPESERELLRTFKGINGYAAMIRLYHQTPPIIQERMRILSFAMSGESDPIMKVKLLIELGLLLELSHNLPPDSERPPEQPRKRVVNL